MLLSCEDVFLNHLHISWACYPYLLIKYLTFSNIEKKARSSANFKEMMSDIHLLQQTPTEKLFLSASNLFLNKWREREHAFTEMFEGNYLKKANKWAEAFSKLCPSTNNGLEATNAAIKENKTLRERLPTNIFMAKMVEIATSWSKRRDEQSINCLSFKHEPSVPLDVWTAGFHMAIDPEEVFHCRVIFFGLS